MHLPLSASEKIKLTGFLSSLFVLPIITESSRIIFILLVIIILCLTMHVVVDSAESSLLGGLAALVRFLAK